ncbi:hypothetical protein Trydic_g6100 [Trypoxylus dichotomus]
MILTNPIKRKMEYQDVVVTIFIHVKKEFDAISKAKFIEKLECSSIKGAELNLLKTYLKDKQQTTKINNEENDLFYAEYGLSQEGSLSRILYII